MQEFVPTNFQKSGFGLLTNYSNSDIIFILNETANEGNDDDQNHYHDQNDKANDKTFVCRYASWGSGNVI